MATAVAEVGQATPISLYIALEEGALADLEAVSRAAIAWSQAIREVAFIVNPALEVRVELVNGTEGSINLNSLITSVRRIASSPAELRAVGYTVAAFFALQLMGWSIGKGFDAAWDWIKSQYAPAEVRSLTEEQQKELATMIARALDAKTAQEKTRKVYGELSKDNAVTGVGVSLEPDTKPLYIVPRSEFAERSGKAGVVEETVQRRTTTDRHTVVLLAPALTEGDQKWRFQLGAKGFWATMDDPVFRARLQPGSNHAPRMLVGTRMAVELETVQEFQDGVWTNVDHRILEVYLLEEPQAQPSWLDAPGEDDQP